MECEIFQEHINYAIENDEMDVLNYLKLVGDDIKDYKYENLIVDKCYVNFGDFSVCLEIIPNENVDKNTILFNTIKAFNNYCIGFDWCDKKSLQYDIINDNERITFDTTIPINPDSEYKMFAFTEFDYFDDKNVVDVDTIFISIRLDS